MRKKFDDIFSRLDKIHECHRRTDGRTDGHRPTASTALTHSIARQKIQQIHTARRRYWFLIRPLPDWEYRTGWVPDMRATIVGRYWLACVNGGISLCKSTSAYPSRFDRSLTPSINQRWRNTRHVAVVLSATLHAVRFTRAKYVVGGPSAGITNMGPWPLLLFFCVAFLTS